MLVLLLTLNRPRRPHSAQTIMSVGSRTSAKVIASRGMMNGSRAGGETDKFPLSS
jgi:hypothetical protein